MMTRFKDTPPPVFLWLLGTILTSVSVVGFVAWPFLGPAAVVVPISLGVLIFGLILFGLSIVLPFEDERKQKKVEASDEDES